MTTLVDRLQDPYPDILDLATSEKPKLYSKAIVGIPYRSRYDPTISNWTEFHQ